MALVGVVVGQKSGIQASRAGVRGLSHEIRRSVDQRGRPALGIAIVLAPHELGTARAAIARVMRIASAPVSVGARHAAR